MISKVIAKAVDLLNLQVESFGETLEKDVRMVNVKAEPRWKSLRAEPRHVYLFLRALLISGWCILVWALMVTDVWDETDLILGFQTFPSTWEYILHIWTHEITLYRPLPLSLAALVLGLVDDFETGWKALRVLNLIFLLLSLAFMIAACRRWKGQDPFRDLLLSALFLFSGSALISAGWASNKFDVSVLFLLCAALYLISRARLAWAGVLMGLSFYCKETGVMALPLIGSLLLLGKLSARDALKLAGITLLVGGLYWILRVQLLGLGGAGDIHGFDPSKFPLTVAVWLESFWQQHVKRAHFRWYGFLFTFTTIALLRPRVRAAALLILLAPIFLYWEMFVGYQRGFVVNHLNFIGRLYLVPAALLLFIVALEGRKVLLALLLLPVVHGAYLTARDHHRFQHTYLQIYRIAESAAELPLKIHFPEKALQDYRRGLLIGDFPEAQYRIDSYSGWLLQVPFESQGNPRSN